MRTLHPVLALIPILGLALATGPLATAQERPKAGPAKEGGNGAVEEAQVIAWVGALPEALAQSKELRQPVMVSVLAGPEADWALFLASLEDPKVRELSSSVICVAACEATHGGGSADGCPHFAGITCEQHVAAFDLLAKRKLLPGTRRVAQHIFLDARGKQLFKRGFGFEGDDGEASLARRMNIALRAVDKSAVDPEIEESESFRLEVLLNRVRERDPDGRRAASAVLGNSDDPKALKAVGLAVNTTGDDADRAKLYEVLAVRGNWSALQLCTGGLGDREARVRLASVRSIELIDMPEAALTLVSHVGREQALLPAALSIKGACFLDPEDRKVVGAALKHSSHNRAAVRVGSCWGMSRMLGNTRVLRRLRQLLVSDKEVNVRAAAAWALGVVGEVTDAQGIARQLEGEKNAPELPVLAMNAAMERLSGGSGGEDYDKIIERLLNIEAAPGGGDGKGKHGKGKGKHGKGKGGKGGR